MEPTFVDVSRDLTGSIITAHGRVIVSVFHKPTQQALYGEEATIQGAYNWLEGAKLIFLDQEGKA